MKLKIIIVLLIMSFFAYFTINEAKSDITLIELDPEIEFDMVKWKVKKNLDYPYRNQMLKDLMANHSLKELKKEQIIELLEQPQRSDNDFLFYTIAQKHLILFPLHTKTLVIKLSVAGTKNKVMVHE